MVRSDQVTIALHSSRLVRATSIAWLGLAILCGGASGVFVSIALADRDDWPQALVLTGLVLMIPLVVSVVLTSVIIGVRLLVSRRGQLRLSSTDLVMTDRWFLREPFVIARGDIASISAIKPPGLFARSAVGRAKEVATTAVLDWGYGFNTRIELAHRRRLTEAIRTPPSKGVYRTATTNGIVTGLFIQIAESDRSLLQQWFYDSQSDHAPPSRRPALSPRRGISGAAIATLGMAGFLLFNLGAFLGAS